MGVETMGTGLKTRLETISDIKRVFAPNELPDSVNEFPVALILMGTTDYDRDFSGSYNIAFRVLILLTKQDQPSALNRIIDYVEPTGDDSIRAAINGDNTLGGAASDCQLTKNLGMGSTMWGGHGYLSTEFEVIVWS